MGSEIVHRLVERPGPEIQASDPLGCRPNRRRMKGLPSIVIQAVALVQNGLGRARDGAWTSQSFVVGGTESLAHGRYSYRVFRLTSRSMRGEGGNLLTEN